MVRPNPAPGVDTGLVTEAERLLEPVVELRRRVHAHPEVGLELPRTQELVGAELASMGLDHHEGRACSSLVAVIEGGRDGPTVLLRADMDALELTEDTGVEFSSTIPGAMHACGHDAHTAMLLGAARLLLARRDQLAGRVVLMFQPGEEGHDGARAMLEEGLLERHGPVARAFAMHISSLLPTGWVSCREGTLMASADEFHLIVTGAGGHASMPHDAVDPVPAACEIVTAAQTMVTRSVSAFDPAVVTVGTIHAGTATNVIPERVVLGGTIRAVSDQTRNHVVAKLAEVATLIAAAHGCTAEFRLEPGSYPVTVNDDRQARHALAVAGALVGRERTYTMPTPVMGAEDWSRVLQAVPGCMAFLGASPPGEGRPAPNHSNRFVIDETALSTGVALYAAMALTPPDEPEI